MVISEVGSRGILFTFEDHISVYLIHAKNRFFLCDTHLGPLSMDTVKQTVGKCRSSNETILFNSHSDWDHIWGNCAFEHAVIIAHESCRSRMKEIGNFELRENAGYCKGEVELKLPNLTFDSKIIFAEDEVEFTYAPGHTVDSAVCFDRKDSVLFVGDLVEEPIPYLSWGCLEAYINTLDFIRRIPADMKISAHSGIIDEKLIDSNIAYIEDVLAGKPVDCKNSKGFQSLHDYNMKYLLFMKYENIMRKKLNGKFDYEAFRRDFADLDSISYHDLEKKLDFYTAAI